MFSSIQSAVVLFTWMTCCLLNTAGIDARAADDERHPGLIGVAVLNGKPTRIAYRYPHGEVFPPDLVRSRFHDAERDLPAVRIELVGYVEVPADTQVDIYHAAGGVNGDHGTLYLDERQSGQVGDDTVKVVIYSLTLPKGRHAVRWVLTGGLFQPNVLKFQDAKTGKLLTLFHDDKQRKETGADKAAETIVGEGKVEGWPPAPDAWTRIDSDLKRSKR